MRAGDADGGREMEHAAVDIGKDLLVEEVEGEWEIDPWCAIIVARMFLVDGAGAAERGGGGGGGVWGEVCGGEIFEVDLVTELEGEGQEWGGFFCWVRPWLCLV